MRKLLLSLAVALPLVAFGGPDPDPVQPARFEKSFVILRTIFKITDEKKLIDVLIKDGRGPLFSIEGLARVYEDRYPDTMTSLRDQSKEFEDRLGVLIDLGEHIKYAKDIGAPAATIRLLQKKFRDDKVEFAQWLRDHKWLDTDDFRLEKWERKVAKTDWDKPKADRKYVLGKLIEITKQLRHKDWDLTELQDGIHDFRWLSIYSQALADLLVLDRRELEKWDGIFSDTALLASKYGNLPETTKVEFPILFPHAVYLELTKAIEELGDAKNSGEAIQEWLSSALLETGDAVNITQAKKQALELVKTHPKYKDMKPTARRIYAYLRQNNTNFNDKLNRGVLVALQVRLKEQRHWKLADCKEALGEE